MGREVERKYRVKSDSWRAGAGAGVHYRQGYLSTDPDRTVRVRIAGDKAFLTIKGKTEQAARNEFEYSIPNSDAEQLLKLCPGPLIQKTRHTIRDGSLEWEIDEFGGDNHGLVLAEVETESDRIATPEWVGQEVTADPRYYNLNLTKHPFSWWTAEEH